MTKLILMEKFNISVAGTGELFNFQVVKDGSDKCEYEVFAGNVDISGGLSSLFRALWSTVLCEQLGKSQLVINKLI